MSQFPDRKAIDRKRLDGLTAEQKRRLLELATTAGLPRRASAEPILAVGQARTGPQPLSFAQQRIWFLSQMDEASAAYHLSGNLRLQGDLDVPALARALDRIFTRHDALRTRFVEVEGS